MTQYTPISRQKRPPQNNSSPFLPSPPSTDLITRNVKTGYQWNGNISLTHDEVDLNWIKLDEMAQGGKFWPLYQGLFLKNRGLDTEGGIFVDNPYNGITTRPLLPSMRFDAAQGYINYRLNEQGDSDFGVTLAEGDFLSHKGNVYLKNGGVKYTNTLKFKSDVDSAMSITGPNVYFGKGSTGNQNSAQVRIGRSGGTRVDIGAIGNALNQETILQIGAAGPTNANNKSGYIKAKQTVLNPPQWNMSFHTYNGAADVEAITIAPNGSVSIPSISNLTSTGPVVLGAADGADEVGDTTIKGDLILEGSFTGASGSGVLDLTISNAASSGLSMTLDGGVLGPLGGNITLTADVDALNEIPLVTDVISWNGVVSGTVPAANATVLATSRDLWGQAFDGSASITGSLTNVTTISSSSNVDLELSASGTGKIISHSTTGLYHFRNADNTFSGAFSLPASGEDPEISADRTYTLPDKDGVVAMMTDVADASVGLSTVNDWTAIQNFTAGLTGDTTGNAATASDALLLNGVREAIGTAGDLSTYANKIVKRDAQGNFFAGTITADLTGNVDGDVDGNAGTVTNGVYTTGNQTIAGTKTFSDKISGSIDGDADGNAGTVTNGVYTSGAQTIGGTKTFSRTTKHLGNIEFTSGNDGEIKQTTEGKSVEFFFPENENAQLTVNNTGMALIGNAFFLGHHSVSGNFGCTGLISGSDGLNITGAITATGDITAFYTSDKRLKENITPIPNALEKVASISGNTFDWNDKTDKVGSETGVIAQEIKALGLPDTVTTREDGYMAVRYEKLVPLLIEAIKELSAKVDAMESKA